MSSYSYDWVTTGYNRAQKSVRLQMDRGFLSWPRVKLQTCSCLIRPSCQRSRCYHRLRSGQSKMTSIRPWRSPLHALHPISEMFPRMCFWNSLRSQWQQLRSQLKQSRSFTGRTGDLQETWSTILCSSASVSSLRRTKTWHSLCLCHCLQQSSEDSVRLTLDMMHFPSGPSAKSGRVTARKHANRKVKLFRGFTLQNTMQSILCLLSEYGFLSAFLGFWHSLRERKKKKKLTPYLGRSVTVCHVEQIKRRVCFSAKNIRTTPYTHMNFNVWAADKGITSNRGHPCQGKRRQKKKKKKKEGKVTSSRERHGSLVGNACTQSI